MIKKYHVSKNLLDISLFATTYSSYCTYTDDTLTITGVTTAMSNTGIAVDIPANTFFTVEPLEVANGIINARFKFEGNDGSQMIYLYDANGEPNTISPISFNFAINKITFSWSNASSKTAAFKFFMINSGTTPLSYEPYGNTWNEVGYKKYGTETETFNTLPKTIIGDGQNISAYTIKGNMQQSGTPTPSNPVYPQETGDKTANLWNEDYTGISDTIIYKPVYVGDGNFTLSTTAPQTSDPAALLFLLSGNVSSGASSSTNGVWNGQNRTKAAVDGYVTVAYRAISSYTPVSSQTMLNTGSTPLPYEPSGYKIPILSNGVSYPIYLSEPIRKISTYVDTAPSTGTANRLIGKYVLTGQESFLADSERNNTIRIFTATQVISYTEDIAISSHFIKKTSTEITQGSDIGFALYNGKQIGFRVSTSLASTPEAFQAWLATQYAAGTPVTVWYVLATAQTESFTAPSIPTTGTAESFDVDTTLKPSEVSLTWHGWHEHSDTKYSNP